MSHKIKKLHEDRTSVTCLDERGRKWVTTRFIFNKFYKTGFLPVPEAADKLIHHYFGSGDYFNLSKDEQNKIVVKLLEAFHNRPIDYIIPSLKETL